MWKGNAHNQTLCEIWHNHSQYSTRITHIASNIQEDWSIISTRFKHWASNAMKVVKCNNSIQRCQGFKMKRVASQNTNSRSAKSCTWHSCSNQGLGNCIKMFMNPSLKTDILQSKYGKRDIIKLVHIIKPYYGKE